MNAAENWLEIKIEANPLILEELSPLFFKMGCQGIEEQATKFTLYFQNEQWDDVKKTALSVILQDKKIAAACISYHWFKDENWNEKWKESFKIFRLGKNIVVKPNWDNYQAKGEEKVLTIAPKMAFGTGHHETTQLILKQLEAILRPGLSLLDAGTGTAILAIYTSLMGASKIRAFDIDPLAIENARENIALNNVTGKIELKCATLQEMDQESYDVIVANINRNVLINMAGMLKNYSKPGTILLLSGLLIEDKDSVVQEYRSRGWLAEASDVLGEWLLLKFIKS